MAASAGIEGAGSKTDPWVPKTAEEFLDVIDENGYVVLKNDIDFSTYNNGIIERYIDVRASLDGQGHSIKNIYAIEENYANVTNYRGVFFLARNKSPADDGEHIQNVNFESIYTEWDTVFLTAYPYMIKNCNISGKGNRLICDDGTNYYVSYFDGCNISFVGDGDPLEDYKGKQNKKLQRFTNCNVKIHPTSPINLNECAPKWLKEFYNTKLEIDNLTANGTTTITGNHNVFIFSRNEKDTTSHILGDKTNILDKTLFFSDGVQETDASVKYLSTSDMKSASKLQAIGFPVVSE